MFSDTETIDDLINRLRVLLTLEARPGQPLISLGIVAETSWPETGLSGADQELLSDVGEVDDADGWRTAVVLDADGFVVDFGDDVGDQRAASDEVAGDLSFAADALAEGGAEDRVGVLIGVTIPPPFSHPELIHAVSAQLARALDGRLERMCVVTGRHLRSIPPDDPETTVIAEPGQAFWREVGWESFSPELMVLDVRLTEYDPDLDN